MARRPNTFVQGAQATLIVLCTLSLLLAVVDSRNGFTSAIRSATGSLMSPLQSAVSSAVRPIGTFFGDWQSLGARKAQISELQQANDRLRAQLHLTEDDQRRTAELDSILRIAGTAQFKIVPATVIAIGASQGYANTVLIDAGSIDGVRSDMNVVSGSGLVGRVVQVWKNQSTVALITDPTSTVGARVEGSGQIGFVSGLGRIGTLQLQMLDPYAPLNVGDRLVSFGVAHGIYATGFPIGTVTSIRGKAGTSTRVADVEPFVSMGALDIVAVMIAKPRTDPRDTLLPPVPKPVVTDTATATDSATATSDAATPAGSGAPTAGKATASPTAKASG